MWIKSQSAEIFLPCPMCKTCLDRTSKLVLVGEESFYDSVTDSYSKEKHYLCEHCGFIATRWIKDK